MIEIKTLATICNIMQYFLKSLDTKIYISRCLKQNVLKIYLMLLPEKGIMLHTRFVRFHKFVSNSSFLEKIIFIKKTLQALSKGSKNNLLFRLF